MSVVEGVTWVSDTSSIVEVRRLTNVDPLKVLKSMEALVNSGRLVFPREVLSELKRMEGRRSPDHPLIWAKRCEAKACEKTPSLEEVKEVLQVVPKVLDPNKDSGVEEADPYVLAMARRLRREGRTDVRIITQEKKDSAAKISLSTASGMLGLASVPLLGFLELEGIV